MCCYSWAAVLAYLWSEAVSVQADYAPEMTAIPSLFSSIPPPSWTWGLSCTSTGSCKRPKPITSERCTSSPTTPSHSPTCASCGTSWRSRAWGPWAPEAPQPSSPASEQRGGGGGRGLSPHSSSSAQSSGMDGGDSGRMFAQRGHGRAAQPRSWLRARSSSKPRPSAAWRPDHPELSSEISARTGTAFFVFFFFLYN